MHNLDLPTRPVEGPAGGHRQRSWTQLRRSRQAQVGAFLLLLMIALALVPGLFAPYSSGDCSLSQSLLSPSPQHLLGTDLQGCDVLTQSIYGTRASLAVGLLVALFTGLLGGAIGAIAGYAGGWIDTVLTKMTEIALSIPLLLSASVLLTLVGSGGLGAVVIALTLSGWPPVARIMRGAVLEVRHRDFVLAARATGGTHPRILLQHVLRNSLAPWFVVVTTNLGLFITYESIVSMLGVGLQPPTISWGQLIYDAQSRFLDAPLPLLAPAGFLTAAVFAFILIGDSMRDALDPKDAK